MPFLTPQEEAPLTACQKCKDTPCIKTGQICKDVEKLLKPLTTGRRSWITYQDPLKLEKYIFADRVKITGKNKKGKEESLYVSKGKRAKRQEIGE